MRILIIYLSLTILALSAFASGPSYLVVTNEKLYNSTWFAKLKSMKESEGHSVGLMVIEDCQISQLAKCVSNLDIRNRIKQNFIAGGYQLKNVLLVGDANYYAPVFLTQYFGYKQNEGMIASAELLNFIPGPNFTKANAPLTIKGTEYYGDLNLSIGSSLGRIWDDNWYVDFYQSLAQEIAIGRIPARNQGEIVAYLNKLEKYKSAYSDGSAGSPSQRKILSVVHNLPEYVPPERTNYYVDGLIKPEVTPEYSFVDLRSANYATNQAMNSDFRSEMGAGGIILSYMSGEGRLNEFHPAFNYIDPNGYLDRVDNLPVNSSGVYPVAIMPICDRGNYDMITQSDVNQIEAFIKGGGPYYDGYYSNKGHLLEEMLLTSGKGVVAFINNRGNSNLAENYLWGKAVLRAYANGISELGKLRGIAEETVALEFFQLAGRIQQDGTQLGKTILLGDPALRLNRFDKNRRTEKVAGLTVNQKEGALKINWSSVAGADGYVVGIGRYRGHPVEFHDVGAETEFISGGFSILEWKNGTTLDVQVIPYVISEGIRSFDRNYSPIISTYQLDLFVSAPTEVKARPEAGSVRVEWACTPCTDVDHFLLERIGKAGPEQILVLDSKTRSYLDPGPEYLTQYRYRVTAVDEKGNVSNGLISEDVMRYARVRVLVKDLALNQSNNSQPVIFVENLDEPGFGNFIVKYWFSKAEDSSNPLVVEPIRLVDASLAKVVLDEATGLGYASLYFPEILPMGAKTSGASEEGERFFIHFQNWKLYNKSTDFSHLGMKAEYSPTERITISQIVNGSEVQVFGANIDLIPEEVPQIFDINVYAKDEAYGQANNIQPRIRIENHGKTISHYTVRFHYTVSPAEVPAMQVKPNYLGDASKCSNTCTSDGACFVELEYTTPLNAGEITIDGTTVMVYRSGWGPLSKSNDPSLQGLAANYSLTSRITVHDIDGYLIHGTLP